MKVENKNVGEAFHSISNFFMNNCECPKLTNGYYTWECINGFCKSCKKLPFPKLLSEEACPNDPITFSQFEQTETP